MQTVDIRPDLKVEIAPLTTREAMQADGLIGTILGDNPTAGALALLTSKVYSLCAVRKINDMPVSPLAGGAAFDAVCGKFSLPELTKLMTAYADVDNVGPEALKNELSAAEPVT